MSASVTKLQQRRRNQDGISTAYSPESATAITKPEDDNTKSDHTSAYCATAKPVFVGAEEKPKPGRLGATT